MRPLLPARLPSVIAAILPAILAALLFVAAPPPARAEEPLYATSGGFALGGYDAVAYFTRRASVPGDRRYAVEWRGAVWLFESAGSMTMFEMDPFRYAPQYGGYCAYAVAKGRLAPGDPEVFSLVGGRLYLSASRGAAQAWQRDQAGSIAAADRNWPGLVKP
ncbi:MAG: YHS domain-containing (seleno)protein [Paracoccaceae bacterium]